MQVLYVETFLSFRTVNLYLMSKAKVPLQIHLRTPLVQRKIPLPKGVQREINLLLIQ